MFPAIEGRHSEANELRSSKASQPSCDNSLSVMSLHFSSESTPKNTINAQHRTLTWSLKKTRNNSSKTKWSWQTHRDIIWGSLGHHESKISKIDDYSDTLLVLTLAKAVFAEQFPKIGSQVAWQTQQASQPPPRTMLPRTTSYDLVVTWFQHWRGSG